MKSARQLFDQAMDLWGNFDENDILKKLHLANDGAIEDYLNINGCRYYQWTPCLVNLIQPKQVVELGGAMGVWTICAAHYLPDDSHLYSITLPEDGLDFAYIPKPPKNVHLIRGDDLEMKNWKRVNLAKTDLWFIDTGIADDHFAEQLQKELKLYEPFFKEGAVILFDDIHKNEGMEKVWESITWDKYDATDPLHYSGFGVTVYDKNSSNTGNTSTG